MDKLEEVRKEIAVVWQEVFDGKTAGTACEAMERYETLCEELRYLESVDKMEAEPSTAEATDFHGDFQTMDDKAKEEIINPKHYKLVPPGEYPDGIEYMDLCCFVLSHLDGVKAHLVGQILKYALRVGKKDDILQDSRKIEWYASYLVKQIEKEKQ